MESRVNRRNFLTVSGAVLGGIATGTTVTAAERTDRFIVETKRGKLPQNLEVIHEMQGVDFAVVQGSESAVKTSRVVKDYAPDVEVQLDAPKVNAKAPTLEQSSVTDEPFYSFQWDKQALDVSTAHETTKGEGTRVAVIDTGVAAEHPDLEVNQDLSRNFTGDESGSANAAGGPHGTHVGGIVGARYNQTGVIGTAPATDLVDCRVFSPGQLASFADILAAIVYSVSIDADAANLSLGAYPIPRQAIGKFYGKVLNRVMTYANKEGTLLVIAAGNDEADLQHDKNFISLPNEGAQGLSVSATGPIGFAWGDKGLESPAWTPAIYTNYGTNAIDLGAPGGNADPDAIDTGVPWYFDLVLNTYSIPQFQDGDFIGANHTYAWLAGTSMAAPQVAGAAALVKSVHPDYNANQVESVLENAAEVPEGYDKTYYGSGFLNIVDALPEPPSGIDEGRVAHYKLNDLKGTGKEKDVVVDSSPYENDGMAKGDVEVIDGKVKDAFEFDGADDYVTIPDSPSLGPQDAITVALWVKTTDSGPGKVLVDKDERTTGDPGYFLALDRGDKNDKPRFLWEDTGGTRHSVIADTSVSDDKWHHVAATYDGSKMKIYVDGAEEGENNVSFTGTDSGASMELMRDTDWPQNGTTYTSGKLDEVRLYDRALSSTEINELADMSK